MTPHDELPQFETVPVVGVAPVQVIATPLAAGAVLKFEKFTVKIAEPFCQMFCGVGVISHEAWLSGGCGSVIVTEPQGTATASRLELTVTLAVFVPAVA